MNKQSKAQQPECECGCGATTKGGRFLPGHDAKLKKSLVEAALGGSKRATAKLEALGWTKFLEARTSKPVKEGKHDPAPVPSSRGRGRPRKNPLPSAPQGAEEGGTTGALTSGE